MRFNLREILVQRLPTWLHFLICLALFAHVWTALPLSGVVVQVSSSHRGGLSLTASEGDQVKHERLLRCLEIIHLLWWQKQELALTSHAWLKHIKAEISQDPTHMHRTDGIHEAFSNFTGSNH